MQGNNSNYSILYEPSPPLTQPMQMQPIQFAQQPTYFINQNPFAQPIQPYSFQQQQQMIPLQAIQVASFPQGMNQPVMLIPVSLPPQNSYPQVIPQGIQMMVPNVSSRTNMIGNNVGYLPNAQPTYALAPSAPPKQNNFNRSITNSNFASNAPTPTAPISYPSSNSVLSSVFDNTTPIPSQEQQTLVDENSPKRCLKCGGYYREKNNGPKACVYHSGQFFSSARMLGSLASWSCCKKSDRNSTGCKIEAHEEDLHTSLILSRFAPPPYSHHQENTLLSQNPSSSTNEGVLIDFSEISSNSTSKVENKPPLFKKEEKKEQKTDIMKDSEGFYLIDHPVEMDDTLAGLAVYYGTTIDDIKSLNNLFTNDIFSRRTLKIRTKVSQDKMKSAVEETKEHKETRLIRRFILATQTKPEEAAFYLSNNDWDFKMAIAEIRKDIAWEQSNKHNMDSQIKKFSKRIN